MLFCVVSIFLSTLNDILIDLLQSTLYVFYSLDLFFHNIFTEFNIYFALLTLPVKSFSSP